MRRKRGAKPKGKVLIKWSPSFAYAIGLLATDGCLSPDGRHISLVSKDKEQLLNFSKALGIAVSIGITTSGYRAKNAFRIQFGDILFYKFLLSIGLTPRKSKTIKEVLIPKKYFFDFLRGCLDGDGYTYSYFDPRWPSSFLFYTGFASASRKYLLWLQKEIYRRLKIKGHITGNSTRRSTFQLKYATRESRVLLREVYAKKNSLCLSRKYLKVERAMRIVSGRQIMIDSKSDKLPR